MRLVTSSTLLLAAITLQASGSFDPEPAAAP
jgi:hypothetical protein